SRALVRVERPAAWPAPISAAGTRWETFPKSVANGSGPGSSTKSPPRGEHGRLHRSGHAIVRLQAADDRIALPTRARQLLAQTRRELVELGLLVGPQQEVGPQRQAAALLDVPVERQVLDDRVGRGKPSDGGDRRA